MDHQLVCDENSTLMLHSRSVQQDGIPTSKPELWNNFNYFQSLESYANFKPTFSGTTEWEGNVHSMDDANEQVHTDVINPGPFDSYIHDSLFAMPPENQETVSPRPAVSPDQDNCNTSSGNFLAESELANKHRKSCQRPPKRGRTSDPQIITVNGEQHRRPDMTYVALIYQAIEESSTKMISLSEIYVSITRRYPFFKLQDNQKGWQNSIRHNLSLNDCFVKHEREPGTGERKGCFWAIDPSAKDLYKDGYHRRRRMKRTPIPQVNLGMQQTGSYCNSVGYFPHQTGSRHVQHTPAASYVYTPCTQQSYQELKVSAADNAGAPFPSTLAHHNNRVMTMTLPHAANSALAQHCNRNPMFHPLNHGSHVNMLQSWAFSHAHLANIYAAHTGAHGPNAGYSAVTPLSSAISTPATIGRFQFPVASATKFVHSSR